MQLESRPGTVSDITGDQLRSYLASHREAEYVLVDVRQPEEYQAGHIPGAKLVPLPDIERRAAEIAALKNLRVIFYCRSGGRSARAAGFAVSALGLPQVHNLLGGFSSWSGAALTDFPRLRALDAKGSAADLLMRALDLEKGAHRFYEALAQRFAGTEIAPTIDELARAEIAHGTVIFKMMEQLGSAPAEGFEATFARLPGELVESGESYEELVGKAKGLGNAGAAALLELAAEVELRAYDLYRTLAGEVSDPKVKETLLDLAQHEKRHAEGVLKRLGTVAAHAG